MLTLASGTSPLVVAPEYGASLTGWMVGQTSIMRRALPQAVIAGNPHAMACFPLLPYGNRIGRRRFQWLGAIYTLAANFGDHPHSIHGTGWQRAWMVTDLHPASVTLTLNHRPGPDWPFAFDAQVTYALTGPVLRVGVQIRNRHDTPAPAGIGIHPYFPKAHNPSLRFNAATVWENGPDSLPSRHCPPHPHWLHTSPRPVASSRLDNCFTAWDGTADVIAGPASLRIEADPVFGQLQVFTPTWADFFCVEPVSHVPDAVNHPDLPGDQRMSQLSPGEALQGTIVFTASG